MNTVNQGLNQLTRFLLLVQNNSTSTDLTSSLIFKTSGDKESPKYLQKLRMIFNSPNRTSMFGHDRPSPTDLSLGKQVMMLTHSFDYLEELSLVFKG